MFLAVCSLLWVMNVMQAFFFLECGAFFFLSLYSLSGAHGGVLKVCWGVVSRLREQILVWFMPEIHKWLSLVYSSSPCPDFPTNSLSCPMLELICTRTGLHYGEQHLHRRGDVPVWGHPCGIISMNLFIWIGISMIDQVIVLTCCALIGIMCLEVQLSDCF